MNDLARRIAQQAARDTDLMYPGDAYPGAIIRRLVEDYVLELNKLKWVGDDDGWNQAVKAIQADIKKRFLG
jgi:hypothetical protein